VTVKLSLQVVVVSGLGCAVQATAIADEVGALDAGRARLAAGKPAEAVPLLREALGAAAAADAPAIGCELGVAYEQLRDLPRAFFFLDGCEAPEPRAALERVRRALDRSQLAPVQLISQPEGASVVVTSPALGERFVAPRDLWLPAGSYHFELHLEGHIDQAVDLVVDGPKRTPVLVTMPVAPPSGGAQTVDFGEGEAAGPGDMVATVDPRPIKRESLLPDRYRRGLGATADADDGAGPARPWRLGLRVGVNKLGMMSIGGDAGGHVDIGPNVSAAALFELALARRLVLAAGAGYVRVRGNHREQALRIDELELPVTAYFVERRADGIALRGGAGLDLSVAVSSDSPDALGDAAPLALGGHAALGVTIPSGDGALLGEVGAGYGFSAILADASMHQFGFTLSVGYLF
jgi:hypothetical protein